MNTSDVVDLSLGNSGNTMSALQQKISGGVVTAFLNQNVYQRKLQVPLRVTTSLSAAVGASREATEASLFRDLGIF